MVLGRQDPVAGGAFPADISLQSEIVYIDSVLSPTDISSRQYGSIFTGKRVILQANSI